MRATMDPVRIVLASNIDWLVGAAGFEPATWSTQNSRATRLRYAPVARAIHGSDFASKPPTAADRSVRSRLLVRAKPLLWTVGPDFGRHHAFRSRSETDQHRLARAQLGDAKTTQRLHVHEDVRGPVAARQEAEAAQTVEPLDHRAFEPAGRRD